MILRRGELKLRLSYVVWVPCRENDVYERGGCNQFFCVDSVLGIQRRGGGGREGTEGRGRKSIISQLLCDSKML